MPPLDTYYHLVTHQETYRVIVVYIQYLVCITKTAVT